mgnify:CR=1 FL=1
MFISALVVLALDQASKALVRTVLPAGKSVDLWVLVLRQVRNPGTAFGILHGKSPALFLASIAIFAVLLLALWRWGKTGSRLFQAAMGLLIGGALGNIIDRIFLGEVVDFIDLRFWPVFNFADTAIVIGVVLAIAVILADTWKEHGETYREEA